jgi:PKD repeat protein
VTPLDCAASICQALQLERERSQGVLQRLTLHRTGSGQYAGTGSFWVGLRCHGRTYRLGSHAPFKITLTVASTVQVQNVVFARGLTATYVNRSRTDSTPCPLGPSHDAAVYSGTDTSPVPVPPTANFTDTVDPATRTGSFTDTSNQGTSAPPVVADAWNFGDPASGNADTSAEVNPMHLFSAPGNYNVTLTVTDANGLTGTAVQTVTVPAQPLPTAARRRAR